MSEPHDSTGATDGTHGDDAHGHDADGHDDHGHAPEALGPIDWRMWAVGVVGVVVALIVTAGFVAATGFQFNA